VLVNMDAGWVDQRTCGEVGGKTAPLGCVGEIVPEDGRKEHGLGAFMNPHNPAEIQEKGKRQYVTEIWEWIISQALRVGVHANSHCRCSPTASTVTSALRTGCTGRHATSPPTSNERT
jgi:hypothetical protein